MWASRRIPMSGAPSLDRTTLTLLTFQMEDSAFRISEHDQEASMPGPEDMRAAVAGYVAALHRAYVAQADTFPPAVRGRMPLLAATSSAGPLTVAAVGARNLHLLA